MWGRDICELQVNLPTFKCKMTCAVFTLYIRKKCKSKITNMKSVRFTVFSRYFYIEAKKPFCNSNEFSKMTKISFTFLLSVTTDRINHTKQYMHSIERP